MYFVAEELRRIMAELGFRNVDEMVGQSQKLNMSKASNIIKLKELIYQEFYTKQMKQRLSLLLKEILNYKIIT
ncbi:MAG: hypothetical protein CM15mP40_09220 [Alphaproteobacteria bacterium]|nr:MAG: hypothetical protein CM15mP40_09220 [Alphaproteobacteria bacterium]